MTRRRTRARTGPAKLLESEPLIPMCCHSHRGHRGRRDDERERAAATLVAPVPVDCRVAGTLVSAENKACYTIHNGRACYRCPPVCNQFTGVTRSLPRKLISPPAGRKIPCFCTKHLHKVQHFGAKDQKVPCCRRRIGLPSGETPGLNTHRVTRVSLTARFEYAPRNFCQFTQLTWSQS